MASTATPDTTGSAPQPRRRRFGCLLLAGLPAAVVANEWLVRPLLNPLRRSPESIAANLLERSQPGSPRADVEAWAATAGWPRGGRVYSLGEEPPLQRVVGEYQSFGFTVLVFAEWVFGPDGRLQTVAVHKWVADAP